MCGPMRPWPPQKLKRFAALAKAGELSYGVIPGLEAKLAEAEAAESDMMVEEAVRPEQVAQVVELDVEEIGEGDAELFEVGSLAIFEHQRELGGGEMTRRRPNLEDLFIKLTGKHL